MSSRCARAGRLSPCCRTPRRSSSSATSAPRPSPRVPSAAGTASPASSRCLPFLLPPSLDDVILPVLGVKPCTARSTRSCQKWVNMPHKTDMENAYRCCSQRFACPTRSTPSPQPRETISIMASSHPRKGTARVNRYPGHYKETDIERDRHLLARLIMDEIGRY